MAPTNPSVCTTISALQNYAKGTPTQFTIKTYAQPSVHVNTVDLGLYAEDDWKIKPTINIQLRTALRNAELHQR